MIGQGPCKTSSGILHIALITHVQERKIETEAGTEKDCWGDWRNEDPMLQNEIKRVQLVQSSKKVAERDMISPYKYIRGYVNSRVAKCWHKNK